MTGPTLPFAGQAVVVTGAASGLGHAIAHAFWVAGARVGLFDIDPMVHTRTHELDPSGQRAISQLCDVADERAFSQAFEATLTHFGGVDVIVNNAAITAPGSVWTLSLDEWDRVMAVNLRGTFIGCRIAGRHMTSRGKGRIINLSSFAGQHASRATGLHYAASKAGVLAVTRGFALELAPSGITVNAVAPSAFESPQLESLTEEKREALIGQIPVGRFGRVEELTSAILWLASDAARYVTGQALDLNGGRAMR